MFPPSRWIRIFNVRWLEIFVTHDPNTKAQNAPIRLVRPASGHAHTQTHTHNSDSSVMTHRPVSFHVPHLRTSKSMARIFTFIILNLTLCLFLFSCTIWELFTTPGTGQQRWGTLLNVANLNFSFHFVNIPSLFILLYSLYRIAGTHMLVILIYSFTLACDLFSWNTTVVKTQEKF